MDTNKEYLDLSTRSLREHLIPAPEWFDNFRKLECSGPVQILLAPEADEKLSEYWLAPYPFACPIYARYLSEKFPNKAYVGPDELRMLSIEDYQAMVRLIETRVESFVRSMIHEEALAMLDSNHDYGVLIHGTTGRIRPFVYSDLHHIEFVNIPVAGEYNIAMCHGLLNEDDATEDRLGYIRELYDDRFELNAWMMPVFRDMAGDRFNNAINHRVSWDLTEACHIKPEDYVAIMTYVEQSIDMHFKVLTIP